MTRVLLVGDWWDAVTIEVTGHESVPRARTDTEPQGVVEALEHEGHVVTRMPSPAVASGFPETPAKLDAYDVVVLSDVTADSLLLHPQVIQRARPFPNRVKVLAEWVRSGGGLAMVGGYLSFQGFHAKAAYHGTPIEEVLPVRILPYDDRVECPEGVAGRLTGDEHEVTAGLERTWPIMLGYQRLVAKPEARVLATIGSDPLLTVAAAGAGRTLAFASDISPHWAPAEFTRWTGYPRLFVQAVTWLAGGEMRR
ncbi:glutamine amidotransferase [Amycolatopsis sp. NBC_00348]|uniref:glutamine amidotransferase n=1 Tax=Amycolatopsis sp. NBC_00348 TaxID=2975956 RepID=UPI002E258F33